MQRQDPFRKCAGCGRRRDKIELLRIVNNKGQIIIDARGDLPGRGVYICPNLECLKKARGDNKITEALKKDIPEEIFTKLTEEIGNE